MEVRIDKYRDEFKMYKHITKTVNQNMTLQYL